MPRLLGVDIPDNKPTFVALQYVHGIGKVRALQICEQLNMPPTRRAKELGDEELSRIAATIENTMAVEGNLRRQVQQNVARLKDIGCYRGMRHRRGLPVRGQRTQTNARTRKGRKKTVAGKKSVKSLR